MKEKIIKIIFLISTIIGIAVTISIMNEIKKENKELAEIENSISELKETVINPCKEIESEFNNGVFQLKDENMNREIDWNELKKINQDIIGWLYIPNTNIDYPILQEHKFGEQYYLHHDYKGDYLYAGSVFTPKQPYEEIEDAHMLLFAHRMKDKTIMFSSLSNYYSDKEMMLENKYVYVYTETKTERFVVWCATNTKSNDAIYMLPYPLGSNEYEELISYLSNKCDEIEENKPTKNDRTLVLSTCSGSAGGSERFYVVFKIDEVNDLITKNEVYD